LESIEGSAVTPTIPPLFLFADSGILLVMGVWKGWLGIRRYNALTNSLRAVEHFGKGILLTESRLLTWKRSRSVVLKTSTMIFAMRTPSHSLLNSLLEDFPNCGVSECLSFIAAGD
jgi:hypothetical protein